MKVVEAFQALMNLPPEKRAEVMAKAKLKREQVTKADNKKRHLLAGAGIQGGIHK